MNAIRSLRRNDAVATDVSWLVSDYTFLEAVDSTDGPARVFGKLQHTLEDPRVAPRILIGRHWEDISNQEHRTKKRVRKSDIIDHELTHEMRKVVLRKEEWLSRVARAMLAPAYLDYVKRKQAFVDSVNAFADAPDNRKAAITTSLRAESRAMVALIRRPSLVTEFLYSTTPASPFQSPKWKTQLEVFPDRLAIGRWARLMAYYAIRRLIDRSQTNVGFSNNYEDATYAFLASYARNIATQDKGLLGCIAAVFPWVSVVPLQGCDVT